MVIGRSKKTRLRDSFEKKNIEKILKERNNPTPISPQFLYLYTNMAESEEHPFQYFPSYSFNDPDFSILRHRLASFKDWPRHRSQTPTLLASAGFHMIDTYRGLVRCFCCGLELRDWQPGDIAMYEHEKFNPTCSFVANEREKRAKRHGTEDLTPFIHALESANRNDLINQGEELLVKIRCKACFTKIANTLLLPCAHVAMCSDCCSRIRPFNIAATHYNRQCPICRSPFVHEIQVYF